MPPARRALALATLLAALASPVAAEPTVLAPRGGPDLVAPLVRAAPSVVRITVAAPVEAGADAAAATERLDAGWARDPWPRQRRPDPAPGLASGVIVGSDGEIVTNAHVVADAERTVVRLVDGREFAARVVGLDRSTDIALLRIDAAGLPAAPIAADTPLSAGEWVVAIGAPFGLEATASAGIVSAPHRVLPGSGIALIQTDVAINPGSSGGPLLNARGEVIGINSMLFSTTGGYMGVSFAVPIDIAMRVVGELRRTGRVTRGQLGMKVQPLTPVLARSFGLASTLGALVLRVADAGPAAVAGLRSGDVIAGIGADTAAGVDQLQARIAAAQPGEHLLLNVWRRGTMRQVAVTVAEAPADMPVRAPPAPLRRDVRFGLNLGELAEERRQRLGLDGGLPVLEVHGAAADAGVRADDVIVAVGDRPVHSLAEFDAALAGLPAARPVALLLWRGSGLSFVAIEPSP